MPYTNFRFPAAVDFSQRARRRSVDQLTALAMAISTVFIRHLYLVPLHALTARPYSAHADDAETAQSLDVTCRRFLASIITFVDEAASH